MAEENEQEHIKVPKGTVKDAEEEEEDEQYVGPLGKVLDPVGKGLGTVLRPVGYGVETLTKPVTSAVGGVTHGVLSPATGTKEEKAEVIGGKNKDSYEHGKEGLGGRLQTGDNPLGLDQTGKWGFQESSKPSESSDSK